jgi:hypothetical protein
MSDPPNVSNRQAGTHCSAGHAQLLAVETSARPTDTQPQLRLLSSGFQISSDKNKQPTITTFVSQGHPPSLRNVRARLSIATIETWPAVVHSFWWLGATNAEHSIRCIFFICLSILPSSVEWDWMVQQRATGWTNRVQSPAWQYFLFFAASRPAMGSTRPSNQWYNRLISQGSKWPVCEADHSPSTSAEVKYCGAITPEHKSQCHNALFSTGTTLPYSQQNVGTPWRARHCALLTLLTGVRGNKHGVYSLGRKL